MERHSPPGIDCSSLKASDPYIGDVCLSTGCIVCRGVQTSQGTNKGIRFHANITLDFEQFENPRTFDYSLVLDVYWNDRSRRNPYEVLKTTASVGEDSISVQSYQVGHDIFNPNTENTRVERHGTTLIDYVTRCGSTALLFVEIEMRVPAYHDMGYISVMQFRSFRITRPSLPATLPPPSIPVPLRDDTFGPLVGKVVFLLCLALVGYWIYIAGKASQRRQVLVDEERAPIIPPVSLIQEMQGANYGTIANLLSSSPSTLGTEDQTTQERPTSLPVDALHEWATKYRDLIPETLEAKLLRAGYLPRDDPKRYTEDEWYTVWDVTRFEFDRLIEAYNNTVRANPL